MSKVLHMIDYEHLMDYEQYVHIELMIEKDMEKAGITWDRYDYSFLSKESDPDGLT